MSYIAEYEKNKKINYGKVAMSVSILSFIVSIIAICLSIKAINGVMVSTIKDAKNNNNIEKTINFVDKVPDVDIVRQDGSVISVKSYDGKDAVSKIIREDEKKQVKAQSNISQSNNNGNVVKTNKKKKKNNVNNSVKEKDTDKAGIYGDYVIQIGSFYNPEQALKECNRVKKVINEKKCGIKVVSANNVRSIVYPFNKKEEATKFSIKINQMLKMQSFVKKNG